MLRSPLSQKLLYRLATPTLIICAFILATTACVAGLVVWKSFDARKSALEQSKIDTTNLARSLAEHASHAIQAADIAMSGMADLLRYQNPLAERFNLHLKTTAHALPQISEFGVLTSTGDWRYSSFAQFPTYNNSDREYFTHHRDNASKGVYISAPLASRATGRPTIFLSKRINNQDGSFGGIVLAAIDSDYFNSFYNSFNLGPAGGVTLIRNDGIVLFHWPSQSVGKDLSKTALFEMHLKRAPAGFYKIKSPFDGIVKYLGYEQAVQYGLVGVVAQSEDELLAGWRTGLRSDIIVATVMLCTIILIASLLAAQFRFRSRIEAVLREREERYRLLADNIADVVLLLDHDGKLLFVSQSVKSVLGLDAQSLVGQSCFDLVHPGDREAIKSASSKLNSTVTTETVLFRIARGDGSTAWLESNFKLAARTSDRDQIRLVSVLRDVTQRITMEHELKSLNSRLAQLATTDGLTGLANRRTFDGFLRREYATQDVISVLLFDIDHFKGFNDSLGHLAGDDCLAQVAKMIGNATAGTRGLSARYGGEEFVVALPGVGEERALRVAEAIRLSIRSLAIHNPASQRGFVSVSVGVASKTPSTTNEAFLVGEADMALYEAKHLGRNRCVLSSSLITRYVDAALAPL
jgi:diguanylate cyclase (GGDEF)-like protein/PAS domain S-box-containing protein